MNRRRHPDSFVFVYRRAGQYLVQGMEDHTINHKTLLADGWEHVETLGADLWIQALLNGSEQDAAKLIDDVGRYADLKK